MAAGSVAWAAGGVCAIDLNLSYMLDQAGYCSDDLGGIVVATGLDVLSAQRVDVGGN